MEFGASPLIHMRNGTIVLFQYANVDEDDEEDEEEEHTASFRMLYVDVDR